MFSENKNFLELSEFIKPSESALQELMPLGFDTL
jgi:hypothetical protein